MSAGALAALVCFWGSIPGPPGVTWSGGWFQATPVRRDTPPCDTIDPISDVQFLLFKDSDPLTSTLLIPGDEVNLKNSDFDPSAPTTLYIHGFLDGPKAQEVTVIKQAYAARGGPHNLVVVGWQRLSAGPWYGTAVANVDPVGRHVARFLDFLEESAGPLKKVHLVGHSLGAHVAGVAAANTTSAKVNRITALDPALPSITSLPASRRLDVTDAPFVDVIHTDGGNFGQQEPLGHVDFYPNGGRHPQPGCSLKDTPPSYDFLSRLFCSHRRSYWFYGATVVRETAYQAKRCSSWDHFRRASSTGVGDCSEHTIPMGFAVPVSARGSYFLEAKGSVPIF